MSKNRLSERTVQIIALEYLVNYYKSTAKKGLIWDKIEVRTKKQFGGFRADGLLAFHRFLYPRPYVVSMESKSFKTLKNLTPYRDYKLWRKNSIWGGFYICVLTGSFFFLWNADNTIIGLLIPILVWLAGTFAYGWVTRNSERHKHMEVIDQILRYPGNEQWLSFSQDSYYAIDGNLQKTMRKLCRNEGIGILIVGANKRVTLVQKPKKHWFSRKDFLTYYSLEDEIKKAIAPK